MVQCWNTNSPWYNFTQATPMQAYELGISRHQGFADVHACKSQTIFNYTYDSGWRSISWINFYIINIQCHHLKSSHKSSRLWTSICPIPPNITIHTTELFVITRIHQLPSFNISINSTWKNVLMNLPTTLDPTGCADGINTSGLRHLSPVKPFLHLMMGKQRNCLKNVLV